MKKIIDNRDENGNGAVFEYSENGYLQAVENYKKGLLHGKATIYFENSHIIASITNFKDGKEHGERFFYYQNGAVMSIANFIEGRSANIEFRYNEVGLQSKKNLNFC